MRNSKWLSVLLALALVLSLCVPVFAADAKAPGGKLGSDLPNTRVQQQVQRSGQYKPGDQVRVVVLTESKPTAEADRFAPLNPIAERKLVKEHEAVVKQLQQKKVDFQVNFEYTALLNGLSVTIDYADLAKVAAIPGVKDVFVAREYKAPELRPAADTASEMINATALDSEIGANGSGKVIAVLDTGITADHEAFGVYPGMLQTPAIEKDAMLEAISQLGHGVYGSQKVPFMYDYADNDSDARDDNSGHGSHVAGIAAGYVATEEGEVTFRGSAPDAQILAMKIFASDSANTSSDIYFAALDDAFKLGADVVNMSIGAPNGFTHDSELEDEVFGNIYATLEEAGVICCISAGNENTMAEYASTWVGPGYVTADYADYGVLGSPASYDGNVAVASVENLRYPAYQLTIGEEGFAYRDYNGTTFLDTFGGQDLEFVMVPDLGVAEAYNDLDVAGKVAVISRGEITFAEKVAYAAAAGAKAAVIYDNQEGSLVTMAIENHTIPAVFVSQAAGAALAALETPTFRVDAEPVISDNPEAYSVSTFSSWGPTNDLQIKPTLSGIGGNVNSVLAGTANGYEVQSGTSMSSPNAAGGYAALLEAICAANPNMSKADAAALAKNRTVSHAQVLPASADQAEDGSYILTPFSPRQQGAGLLDVHAAYHAVLDVADPLVELGDDPDCSGVYTVSAQLTNTSDAEQTYAVRADVLTDTITYKNWGSDDAPDYHFYNLLTPALLEAGVDYTLDAPESVTLAAGETKTVTATITLSDDLMDGYLAFFDNGAFIEGYLYFENETEQAHATFLAFYGDWTQGPILETHDWRELLPVEIDPTYSENPMDYVDWEINTVPSEGYLVDGNNTPKLYFGDAPFGYPEGGVFSPARIAVSNNADSAYFTNALVVPTIIRNARHVIMIARNAETGEIYAVDDTPYCTRTIYDATEGTWYSSAWFAFNGMDIYGEKQGPIADDTQVVLEFYANLPYGEDALGAMTPEEIVENGQQYLGYTVSCVVDGAAPEIESCEYDPATGDVTVTVSDNQYLNAIYVVDAEGKDLGEMALFADDEPGETHTATIHIGMVPEFYVAAIDYATNESYVAMEGATELRIIEHPEDASAKVGDDVTFTVVAEGDGLTYQWYFTKPGKTSRFASVMEGSDEATITVPMTADRDGQTYLCKVMDQYGNEVWSEPAVMTIPAAPVITVQPTDQYAPLGSTVTLSVEAVGEGLTYQWQYQQPGKTFWYDSTMPGADSAQMQVQLTAKRDGQHYRCVVTNAAGVSVVSDEVAIGLREAITITSQPEDVTAAVGETAKFAVTAEGEGLTYQWQYQKPGKSGWYASGLNGANSAELSVPVTNARNGQSYRCVITDVNGNTVTSAAAALTVG